MNLCKYLIAILFAVPVSAEAHDTARAELLANAGVLITHGDTKIVFDPLFDNDYEVYALVPEDVELALFNGAPPFDGLDAVFVSHHHGDHFSPEKMLRLLRAHEALLLFGPQQAIDALPLEEGDAGLAGRLHAVTLQFEEEYRLLVGDLTIDAVRLPHSGWPRHHADVENIAFRVSLDKSATVLHLGDAHSDDAFFQPQAEYWKRSEVDIALPPYWFFLSPEGEQILEQHVDADVTIGVHVPKAMPDDPNDYPPELTGKMLFTEPGQSHDIVLEADAKSD